MEGQTTLSKQASKASSKQAKQTQKASKKQSKQANKRASKQSKRNYEGGIMTKKFRQLGATVGLLLLMVLLLISVYTYVLYQNFSRNMLEAALTRDTTCADAIHRLASDEFTREDFDDPAI